MRSCWFRLLSHSGSAGVVLGGGLRWPSALGRCLWSPGWVQTPQMATSQHRKTAICGISWCDLWGHTVDEEFCEKFRLAELYGFDPLRCFADSSIFFVPIFGALCATAAERSLAVPICGVPEDSRIRDGGRQDVVECHLFILALCSVGHCFCSWPFLPSPGSEADFVPDHLWTTFRNPRESLRCLVAKGCRNVSL